MTGLWSPRQLAVESGSSNRPSQSLLMGEGHHFGNAPLFLKLLVTKLKLSHICPPPFWALFSSHLTLAVTS